MNGKIEHDFSWSAFSCVTHIRHHAEPLLPKRFFLDQMEETCGYEKTSLLPEGFSSSLGGRIKITLFGESVDQ